MDILNRNMHHYWFLLFLVAAPGGVLCQVQLQESGPSLVMPSQTLSLTCSVSGFSMTNSDTHWVRQAPGKGLDWVGSVSYTGIAYYNPSLQSRTSISRDTSIKQLYLDLRNAVPEDTAVYFCARGRGRGYQYFDYWGQGTMVTVSSASLQRPTVFPLSLPSSDASGNLYMGCLVRDFFPLPANVSWGQDKTDFVNFPAVSASGGLYTMSSQLHLRDDQCQDSVECHVLHNSETQTVTVPCKATPPEPPTPTPTPPPCAAMCNNPRMSLHKPALEDLLLGFEANLTCTLTGLRNPEGVTFSWTPLNGKKPVQGPSQKDTCGCYSVSSYLPGCAEPWNRGEKFTCTATLPDSTEKLTATISKSQGKFLKPLVHLLPPPSEELALNELVTLTCMVRGFSPEDALVLWLHGNQQVPRNEYMTWSARPEPGQRQSDTTFAVTSVLRVDAEVWKKGDSFSCMVGHDSLPNNFTQKTIDRLAGKPTHVNVSVVMAEADGVCY